MQQLCMLNNRPSKRMGLLIKTPELNIEKNYFFRLYIAYFFSNVCRISDLMQKETGYAL